ncbi:MAG: polysaccharide biosynthesis protein [Campylobacter sp.]|nr:polysaccharide biosynthesis protein [Campylobacter sp.]
MILNSLLTPTKLKRTLFFISYDCLASLFATLCAFLLRFSGEIPPVFYKGLVLSALILMGLRVFFMWIYKIYKVPWRFFGLHEARKIFNAHLWVILSFSVIFIIFEDFFNPFPRSVIIIDAAISYILIGGFRITKRLFFSKTTPKGRPCVIIGATKKTIQVLKGIDDGFLNYYAVGVFDSRDELVGTYIQNHRVQPISNINELVRGGVKTAIIAFETTPDELKQIYEKLNVLGIKEIKIFTLLDSNEHSIRDISIEDLLARKPKDLDKTAIKEFIKDKTVLITGAGGSIGSELCKQCEIYGAKRLILVENSEFNLYKINEFLKVERTLNLVDITRKNELEDIFKQNSDIDIVLHAAAYKHVPLCEFNPKSAVKNNILGTKILVDLCKEYKIPKFVLISSDKAVRPTSIMGATKRVCELYALNSSSDVTQIVAVRFGNVLGSSGSVIPKFKAQIANNQPLSVTHKDITRYFMLVGEACELVLQAASMAKGGELFVLDMGEPVKIVDLAKKMLELAGKSELGIKIVGLRPGEKLYEELLVSENDKKTKYNSIFVTHSGKCELDTLNRQIDEISKLFDGDEILSKLKEIVVDFNHQK